MRGEKKDSVALTEHIVGESGFMNILMMIIRMAPLKTSRSRVASQFQHTHGAIRPVCLLVHQMIWGERFLCQMFLIK